MIGSFLEAWSRGRELEDHMDRRISPGVERARVFTVDRSSNQVQVLETEPPRVTV